MEMLLPRHSEEHLVDCEAHAVIRA